ncbi:DNA polymerase III subunit delta' [Thioalkalivibrio denitrificans]|uniref:DNA polymerase III subunit delta' n=1 Tax=Thioalkalivibrio denitrificans TaxID=108003 RepID=A0A1V3N868_9GAMM|nr:DNA polymerase III subunit delta' [Thioalkalivibrio denitrificans]OOG21022.1 DNA polymerase III subunit delta' [Thioalkalivibrio denitrificans]
MTAAPYPWLEGVFRQLLGRLAAERMPHALLLSGPAGIGKRALAEAVAGAALCTDRDAHGGACGRCASCRLHRAGTHPDRADVTIPEERTGILVDQIRELAEAMGLSRSLGDHRVAVLWPADAMNPNAANSLLKTLEEPAERSLMILVSAQPSLLPATVRSRCQIVSVTGPDDTRARAWLLEQGIAETDLETLLCLSRGAPLTAQSLAEEGAVAQWQALLADLAALCSGSGGVVTTAERWKQQPAARLVHWIQIALWEAARLAMNGHRAASGAEDLQRLAKSLDLERALTLQERLADARRVARTPVNQQLLLEDVFAEITAGRH